ncbi:peptidase M3 [bacterium CG_4_9_14_3_um_filter_65_15]|nr:MAG: peptidase M3 [bacterium CG_4_9_14_3_um_filter_65_15]
MRKVLLIMALSTSLAAAGARANPFFETWDTPFGVPPFDRITTEDFEPAFMQGMADHTVEIAAIAADPSAATFANTIEALDTSGALLSRVSMVFSCLIGALTNDELQEVARELAPQRSRHRDEINLNEALFARVNAVYDQREQLDLNPEQRRLLSETWKGFVRGGALLGDPEKEKLKELNQELSVLSLKFGENVLKETNRFEYVVGERAKLDGLPDGVIAAAAETAAERGHPGQWAFTIQKPSLLPFLQFSTDRQAREKMLTAYTQKGNHGDELDNNGILARMAVLRAERAHLLGFDSHAAYVLDDNMAKTPDAVYKLLDQVWWPAQKKSKEEAGRLQGMIDAEDGGFELQPWDWWYYTEKLRKQDFDLDESMLRPYFELESVRAGLFETVRRLYGLTFKPRPHLPVYHPDVKAYEVLDREGSTVAIWYSDYFPRASKRGGAWMDALRKESYRDGKRVIPIIYNVGNFTKPTADQPSLLSLDELTTMFHEFGHALHGMLSNCRYQSLSGTSVARDFVEMPSQIMENWALEPEVLDFYAKHYKTGERIPSALVEKIKAIGHFNQGFETAEYVAASYLDMDWHTITDTEPRIPAEFEKASLERIGLIPEIVVRYRSPYFNHIFSGGYSSGYYSYLWAEVLDADAFAAFKETGDIFDPATALSFRKNILEAGGSEDPMVLYERFRGQEPSIRPLLERRGLAD